MPIAYLALSLLLGADPRAGHFARQALDLWGAGDGAVGWRGTGSSRLLLALQSPPHSSCKDMGAFEVVELDLRSGRAVARYREREARRRFGALLGTDLTAGEQPAR